MVPRLLQGDQDLQILQIAFGDLLSLGIVIKIVQPEDPALTGKAEVRVVSGHVDFVLELQTGQGDPIGVQLAHQLLKVLAGQFGAQKGERRP
jgi:hypothetical protein